MNWVCASAEEFDSDDNQQKSLIDSQALKFNSITLKIWTKWFNIFEQINVSDSIAQNKMEK